MALPAFLRHTVGSQLKDMEIKQSSSFLLGVLEERAQKQTSSFCYSPSTEAEKLSVGTQRGDFRLRKLTLKKYSLDLTHSLSS